MIHHTLSLSLCVTGAQRLAPDRAVASLATLRLLPVHLACLAALPRLYVIHDSAQATTTTAIATTRTASFVTRGRLM